MKTGDIRARDEAPTEADLRDPEKTPLSELADFVAATDSKAGLFALLDRMTGI